MIISGRPVYGVGVTYHLLETLIKVMACLRVRMSEPVAKDYLTRAEDPKKHVDMLSEFAPILNSSHLQRWSTRSRDRVPETEGSTG